MTTNNDYQIKQKVSRLIESGAKRTRQSSSTYDMNVDMISYLCNDLKKLNHFAAKIAETVEKTIGGFCVAKISSKQAWIMACAAVENGLQELVLGKDYMEDDEEE